MQNKGEDCETCRPDGLKLSNVNGITRVEVPQDFGFEDQGGIGPMVDRAMAVARHFRVNRPDGPMASMAEYGSSQPPLYVGPTTANDQFTLAQTAAADVIPTEGYGPQLLGMGAQAAEAVVKAVGDQVAAGKAASEMVKFVLARVGKFVCDSSDFATGWAAMLDGTREDCTKMAYFDQILCNARNEAKDNLEDIYKAILMDKNAWQWEVRREFIKICDERRKVYEASQAQKK